MHPDFETVQRDLLFICHMEEMNGFFAFKDHKVKSRCFISQQSVEKSIRVTWGKIEKSGEADGGDALLLTICPIHVMTI